MQLVPGLSKLHFWRWCQVRSGAGSQEWGQGPAGRERQSSPGAGGCGVGACLPTVLLQQQPGAEITRGGVPEEGSGQVVDQEARARPVI